MTGTAAPSCSSLFHCSPPAGLHASVFAFRAARKSFADCLSRAAPRLIHSPSFAQQVSLACEHAALRRTTLLLPPSHPSSSSFSIKSACASLALYSVYILRCIGEPSTASRTRFAIQVLIFPSVGSSSPLLPTRANWRVSHSLGCLKRRK